MPDSAESTRILELIHASPANHEYFFEQLDDPAWLPFLTEAGFFSQPPEPERDEQWIRFPAWSESRFLARIAGRAPDGVFAIARKIPDTENVRVHEDVLAIAINLPSRLAARLARREAKWLNNYTGPLMSLPEAAGKLLAALGAAGEARAAFALAGPLLRIVPATGAPRASRRRATALMNEWSYRQIVETAWPTLAVADPVTAFRFLCDRLADAVRIGCKEPNGNDYSYVWRSAIGDHAQNLGHSLLDTLVELVRDAALEYAASPGGQEIASQALDAYEPPVFRRIGLHVLQRYGSPEQVAVALTDRGLANDIHTWHEYGELLGSRYPDLSADQRAGVLDLIDQGPANVAVDDDGQTRARRWQFLHYAPIAEHLTGHHRAQYEALVREFGPPAHPTFLSFTSSWTGPTSPFSTEELQAMEPAEIASKIREWRPGGDPADPSPEGLARTLEDAVAARAKDFAAHSAIFIGLEATYARGILGGFREAAKQGTKLAWPQVLALCDWAVEQPRHSGDAVADRDWGWARKEVADLLSTGFAEGPATIPQDERARVWALLKVLATDPDPAPFQEERPDDESMDPLTLSINTTRGEALHATVRYALWVERALTTRHAFAGMRSLPEVAALLEQHLDTGLDPSFAIRAVYGQWFAQFVRMDTAWAKSIAPLVFPATPGAGRYFDAAWNPYITFTPAWTDVFAVLVDVYSHAIERMASHADHALHAADPRERLGDHLLRFRVLGVLPGAEDDDLFTTYWRAAEPDVREQVLTQAGWSLERTSANTIDGDIRDRFMRTWGWILAHAHTLGTAELAGFGAWLGASIFEASWLLSQARAVLEFGVHLKPSFEVYKALPRLAAGEPRSAIEVLRLMTTTDEEGWSLAGSEQEAREVLAIGLASEDAAARAEADALIELLGARGMTSYRNMKS